VEVGHHILHEQVGEGEELVGDGDYGVDLESVHHTHHVWEQDGDEGVDVDLLSQDEVTGHHIHPQVELEVEDEEVVDGDQHAGGLLSQDE